MVQSRPFLKPGMLLPVLRSSLTEDRPGIDGNETIVFWCNTEIQYSSFPLECHEVYVRPESCTEVVAALQHTAPD